VPVTEFPPAKPTLWSTPLESFPDFTNQVFVVANGPPSQSNFATGRITVEVEGDDSLTIGYELGNLAPMLTTINERATVAAANASVGTSSPTNSLVPVPGASGRIPTGIFTAVDEPGGSTSVSFALANLIPTLTTTISRYPGFTQQEPTGTVTVKDNTDGSILIEYSLDNLRANSSETLQIHEGVSCAAAGVHHFDRGVFTVNPWLHEYSADARGHAAGAFNVSTGFAFLGNVGRAVVINGFDERSGCGLLAPLEGTLAIVDSMSCASSSTGNPLYDANAVSTNPWAAATYTIEHNGTASGVVSVITGLSFDDNVGHAIVVFYEGAGVACGELEAVQSSIRIHSGFSCATVASVGASHFLGLSDPFDSAPQFASSAAPTIQGSFSVATGFRFFENSQRAVVVDYGGTSVSCATLSTEIIPFFWECYNMNENADCGIELSLSENQTIAANQLTADRYRFTVNGHLATNASTQDTVLIDILNESIPVSIAWAVEGVNSTIAGARALPSSVIELEAVLDEQELINGQHFPNDNHDLAFDYTWSVGNFGFSDYVRRLRGDSFLQIPNNEVDPRFAVDSTIGVAVFVTALSGRLQRNITGSAFVNFTIPPGPFGGNVSAGTDSGSLIMTAPGWVAGFVVGQPLLPSAAPLRYEFFLCTSSDCEQKSFYTTGPTSSTSLSVEQFPDQNFTIGVRVSWRWGFTDLTTTVVGSGPATVTALQLLQEYNTAFASNAAVTTTATSLRVLTANATGSDSEFRDLFAAVLTGTVARYNILGFERATELLQDTLDRILATPRLLEECNGFYCAPSASHLLPTVITTIDAYASAASVDIGERGDGTLTPLELASITRVLSLAVTASRQSPEIHFTSAVTTREGAEHRLIQALFTGIQDLGRVGRGPSVAGVQPIIGDGQDAADLHAVLHRLDSALAASGVGSLEIPGAESPQAVVNSRASLRLPAGSFDASVNTSTVSVAAVYTLDTFRTSVRFDWDDQAMLSTSPAVNLRFYGGLSFDAVAPSSYYVTLPLRQTATVTITQFSTRHIPLCHVWDSSSETWTHADSLVRTLVFSATDVTCQVLVAGWTVAVFTRFDAGGNLTTVASPKGSFTAGSEFIECGFGRYQNVVGQSSCIDIPVGSYCTSFRKTACESISICPVGTFCDPADGRVYNDDGGDAIGNLVTPWGCKGDTTLCTSI
jgi:hypothetical protein